MLTGIWLRKDACSAIAVGLIWFVAAAMDQAHAEVWVPVDHAELDIVFLEQSAALQGYHSVMIDPLSVWFRDAADETTDADGHLRAFRGAYFEAFSRQLPLSGLDVVSEPGPGVLRIHVEVIDLMVNGYSEEQLEWASGFSFPTAPDRLTLVAELSDAETGAVLVRIADLGIAGEDSDVWYSVRQSFDSWAETLGDVVSQQGPAFAAR